MDRLTPLQLRAKRTLRITLAWVVVGMFAALFEHNALLQHSAPSDLLDRVDERFLRSLVAGLIGGGIYIFLLRDRLRKYPYFTALGIMALLMLPVIVFTAAVWPALRSDSFGATFEAHLISTRSVGQYFYWTMLMGGSMFMVRLNDQYGSGGISYLTGRYHEPREEMRVFMFLDMRSSTAIAEELGHVKYFRLLNELYADITDPIVYSRGEIYQYVGDEISVSWPLRRGVGRLRCIRCFLDIRAKLQRRAKHYEARYGILPAFKAGFHYGQVTTGEVGLVKKERIFSGDVVNTAARIQNSCNEHGVDNLISKELLDLLRPQARFTVREIGSIALKGKRNAMSLWTIEHGDGVKEKTEVPAKAAQNV